MPATQKLGYRLTIKVDGRPFSTNDLDDLIDLTVDTDTFLPAMFDIALEDDFNSRHDAFHYMDGELFKIGAAVVISIESTLDIEHRTLSGILIDGEVTSLEPEFGNDGRAIFHVRGYDRAHRLMSGEKTRAFGSGKPNTAAEADIVRKIAQEAGLSSDIDSSGLSGLNYAYVLQYGQTDWDFLWERARRIGYQVYVEEKKLVYRKANQARDASAQTVELEWGKDLASFEPRLSVMGQDVASEVTGWDPDKKQKVTVKCTKASLSTLAETGFGNSPIQFVKSIHKQATNRRTAGPVATQSQAKVAADANLSARENNLIQASGFMLSGDPRVLAGGKIKVIGVGKKFSGTYFVTRARHTISRGQYQVHFDVSGSGAHTLLGLLQPGFAAAENGKTAGPTVGIVTNIDDPDKLGRIQVKYPWLPSDAELSSNWARVAAPGAGKDSGILFLPEIDDEVLVAFEHGDINAPYILGGLWNKRDVLPKGSGNPITDANGVKQHIIRTRSGHEIIFDDTGGKEQILIQDKSKENSILIDTAKNGITMKSKADFTIEAGGKFVVKAKGDVSIESTGKLELSSQKAISIKALQEAIIKVSSSQLALKTSGTELAGLTVDVKASTKVSVSGSAMAEIKGGLVKIN